ncbi:MAG TPA: hypothetical protein VFI23_14980 [Rhizomicrobium sp.]|nr:hypothetical protein [Rhizomicrobium sp.]
MADISSDKIEYRTPCRLSDQIKLQFRCSFYFLRYFWIISAVVAAIIIFLNAMSLWADPWSLLMPIIAGLIGGSLAGPIIVVTRRAFRKPDEIRAEIGDEGIKVIGQQGFNYEANWQNLSWIGDGGSAYVMRFKKLFIRLPKRGFATGQESAFRNLVCAHAPVSARFKPNRPWIL